MKSSIVNDINSMATLHVSNHSHMAQTNFVAAFRREKFNLIAIHIKCLERNEAISSSWEEKFLRNSIIIALIKELGEAELSFLLPSSLNIDLFTSHILSIFFRLRVKLFSCFSSLPCVCFIEDSGFAMWKLI